MTRPDDTLGLYIHVPFCASKCPYCDFYSHGDPALTPAYVSAVEREISTLSGLSAFTDADVFNRRIASVYFGGGTPSVLDPAQIGTLLAAVNKTFSLLPDAEITLEVNPSLQNKEAFFESVAEKGVNRVSVGLQSAVDEERRALGRLSGASDAAACVAAAKAAGVTDVSLDLMLGIPGQTEESLKKSLCFALEQEITHISAYILTLEPGTVFYKKRETLRLPDEDAVADLYLFMCETLNGRGMRHYEISNFCFGEHVGRHNLRYWEDREYLGFGPAAHSFYKGRRFYFANDLAGFLNGAPCIDEGDGGGAREAMMLALRTDTGVSLSAFRRRFGITLPETLFRRIETFQTQAYLSFDGENLSLTDRGMLLSNAVIAALLDTLPEE